MKKLNKKLAITLSLLIGVQFICFTPTVSAHEHQEIVDCCDTQFIECRLEERSSVDNNLRAEKEIILENLINSVSIVNLKKASTSYFLDLNLPDKNLKEISTIRLLL